MPTDRDQQRAQCERYEVREVPSFAPFCLQCGENILASVDADYVCYADADGADEARHAHEIEQCGNCFYPLTDSEEEYMRDTLANCGLPAHDMALPLLVEEWVNRLKRLAAERKARAAERRYGVRVTKYGD